MEKENVTYRARIVNNIIANNRVGGNSDAGGVYCEYDSSVEITNNYLVGNAAEDDGGAIYVMKSSEPTIAGNVIAGNAGKGAIRLSKEGRARIEGNLIAANDGGVTCGDSWMTLAHNVIVGNAGYGVAYSNNRLPHVKPSLLTHNLICANTGAQIIVEAPEPPVVTHSRVQGGYAGDGNTDASPVFLDDGAQGTAAAVAFDPGRFLTTISLPAARFETGELAGRVARIGAKWSVIHSNGPDRLVVWGDARTEQKPPVAFEILRTYRRLQDAGERAQR
jgi:parallel beta-helix repeat protein